MWRNVERVWRYHTGTIGRGRKVVVLEKINPFGLASIAAGIPPAAFACRAEARTHFNWHKKKEVET